MARLGGNMEASTFEPSSGGMGMRLKKKSITLMSTMMNRMSAMPAGKTPRRMIRPPIIAIARFEKGPAWQTIASLKRPGRRLYGLYGTGFAQPKRMGELVRRSEERRV